MEERFQAEKADREARTFEDIYNVGERYLNQLISGEKDKIFKKYGVAIFTLARNAASDINKATDASIVEGRIPPGISKSEIERCEGYRLVSRAIVPLVFQDYKEKVAFARA